jgi:hypothetical protein
MVIAVSTSVQRSPCHAATVAVISSLTCDIVTLLDGSSRGAAIEMAARTVRIANRGVLLQRIIGELTRVKHETV